MKRLAILFTVIVALSVSACVQKEPTTPKPPVDTPEFKVEIDAITRSTVTLSVTPKELDMEYLCLIYEKEFVEEFTRDEFLASSIYQEIEDEAYAKGKTLAEYMPTIVERGAMEGVRYSGMQLDSEYYVVLFGVDAANEYSRNTNVVKVPFRTLAVEKSDLSFDVGCSVIDNSVVFDVNPSDPEAYWYLFTVTKEQYDYYVNDENGYRMSEQYFYEYYFQQEINAFLQAGYSQEQVIEALIHSGHLQLEAKGLKENTVHYYLIAGLILDSEGIVINTDIFKGDYTTESAAKAELSFEIEVWDVTQLTANVRITPSNDTDKYCALIQPWDGVTPANDMMHKIVNQWGGWMDYMANDKGMVEHVGSNAFKLPAADTNYYVIAFGYNGGITSDAYMKTFRTLPGGSVEEVEFSVSASTITPYSLNMTVTSSDPTIFYVPGACVAEGYDEAAFVAAEQEAFDYYYNGSKDFNPSITVAEVLDQYYYNGTATVKVSGLVPDTQIMAYVYALDVHTGRVVKCFTFDNVATTDILGDSTPVVELFGYFSGDDEAGTIFNDAAATQGKAITVVKYSNIGDARSLFTTMVEGDCSNKNAMSDSEVWYVTDGYWAKCSLSQPYTYYLVDWNVVQTALCYVVDNNGKMGTMGRLYTMPTANNKSNIEELRTLVEEQRAAEKSFIYPSSIVVEDIKASQRATISAL